MQFHVIVKNSKRESQQKATGLHREKVIFGLLELNQERVVEGSASFRSTLICDITTTTKWVPVTCLRSLK